MTSSRFVVELPQHNSDREGTLEDIRGALERLMHVSSTIFERVESKVKEESNRLEVLEGRVINIKKKIATIASQPSKACRLISSSRLPEEAKGTRSIFADFPIQRLGESPSEDFLYNTRSRTVVDDNEPIVPYEALVRMDSEISQKVASRIQLHLDQENAVQTVEDEMKVTWWWSRGNGKKEENKLGPPPPSLQITNRDRVEPSALTEYTKPGQDVGYKPRAKEVHQLGLPSTLGGLLPDVAEHSVLSWSRAPLSHVRATKEDTSTVTSASNISSDTGIQENNTAHLVAQSLKQTPSHHFSVATKTELQAIEQPPSPSGLKDIKKPTKSADLPKFDSDRSDLLAAIRQGKPLVAASARPNPPLTTDQKQPSSPPTVKRPISLADEMREKLIRRQKALSGERDEEEQQEERRRRKGRMAEKYDDASSESGSSVYSSQSFMLPSIKAQAKRSREPPSSSDRSSQSLAGIDALLKREFNAKSHIVPPPPPKPASSVGDWDD